MSSLAIMAARIHKSVVLYFVELLKLAEGVDSDRTELVEATEFISQMES